MSRFCWLMLIGAILFACFVTGQSGCSSANDERPADGATRLSDEIQSSEVSAERLAQESELSDATVWAAERLAQRYEVEVVRLWDELRQSPRPGDVLLSRFPSLLTLGRVKDTKSLAWDIRQIRYLNPSAEASLRINPASADDYLSQLRQQGFRLVQSEWHHRAFRPPTPNRPAESDVSFEFLLHSAKGPRFRSIKGVARIRWRMSLGEKARPVAESVELVDLVQTDRSGRSPFRPAMNVEPSPRSPDGAVDVAPLVVEDLNGDGLPEIILGGSNLVLWNRGSFTFDRSELFSEPIVIRNSAVVADFTGDGRLDFLGVDQRGHAVLAAGKERDEKLDEKQAGPFGKAIRCSHVVTKNQSALTVGDVDADGDLDVFLAQYKTPYQGGQMPTPYYDANDGYPSYLLLNDGKGHFTDGTVQAGLEKKRFRRTYSSSLVDLDDDGDLDLIVVSDFAGLDAYENDGHGVFREATERWFAKRSGFGMSHTFGDFNGDGREDLYIVGMSSTTARRLDRLGLGRADFPQYTKMRGPMTYGNRLLLSRGDRFIQPELSDQTARCGWAWGTAASDFDNDADADIYVANGHLSGRSARDYCTRFWCHDIYAGSSKKDAEVARFLSDEFRPPQLRGLGSGEISWNGYEHNKFFVNNREAGLIEIGPLLGLASEADSRSVVAADLDRDGRQDLLVVSNRWARPERRTVPRQSLLGWWNQLETTNHWIGIDLQCRSGGASPIGAKVTIRGEFGQRTASVVTGDSFFSQHPTVVHFGLGEIDHLDSIQIRWPDGSSNIIENPEVDRYHVVLPAGIG